MPTSKPSSPHHPASLSSTNNSSDHLHDSRGGDLQVIVTTEYLNRVLTDEEHSEALNNSDLNTRSPSLSLDDLDTTSSLEQQETKEEEQEAMSCRFHDILESEDCLDGDGTAPILSSSAPDLSNFSDIDNLEAKQEENEREVAIVGSGQSPFSPCTNSRQTSVKDSMLEHRLLRQLSSHLPPLKVNREETYLEDAKKDLSPSSLDEEFVVLHSPMMLSTSSSSQLDKDPADIKETSVPSKDVLVAKIQKAAFGNVNHRRSLSTPDATMMQKGINTFFEGASGGGGHDGRTRLITINGPVSMTGSSDQRGSPMQCLEQGRISTPLSVKSGLDEQYLASSIQTLDSSQQGSDNSDEESFDKVPPLNPYASDGKPKPNPTHSDDSNTSAEGTVILRSREVVARRAANMMSRYSAEGLITIVDDEVSDGDDDGEATPTLSKLAGMSNWMNKNTSTSLTTIGKSDRSDANQEKAGSISITSDEMIKEEGDDGDKKKISISSTSSEVFEQEGANLSDMVSDKRKSHEYDVSLSMEGDEDFTSKFYKRSGSPKTLRKRSTKSPNTQRKRSLLKTKKVKEDFSTTRGLKNTDITPTIAHLKRLFSEQDELEEFHSDDSDATVGSLNKLRSSSIVEVRDITTAPGASSPGIGLPIIRSSSDSPPVSGDCVSNGGIRSPLQTVLGSPGEGSSLDFGANSIIASRNNTHLQDAAHSSAYARTFSNSSPNSTLIKPLSKVEEEEVEVQCGKKYSTSQEARPEKFGHPCPGLMNKTGKMVSVYETCTEPTNFFFDPNKGKDAGESSGKTIDKEQESSVKRLKSFFLGSKQSSKKLAKVSSAGKSTESEAAQDLSASQKPTRAKSAKLRSKDSLVDTTLIISRSPSTIARDVHIPAGGREAPLEKSGETVNNDGGDEVSYLSLCRPDGKITTHYKSDSTLATSMKTSSNHHQKSVTIVDAKVVGGSKATRSNTDPTGNLSSSFPPQMGSHSQSPPPLATPGSGDESDNDESTISLTTHHPELYLKEEVSWEKTIDRKVYRKMQKAEREHQAILHELVHTEKQYLRSLYVLKLIFRAGINKDVSVDMLEHLFPKLDELIQISDSFIDNMEAKREGILINDLSNILLQQFSESNFDNMLDAFGGFCSGHLYAMEHYKELMKKKSFARLMKDLHSLKECHRLELPDYYTKVTQRLPQIIILLRRLVKKMESLSMDQFPTVQESLVQVMKLVTAVDQAVEDRKNLTEIKHIEERLEINVPKSARVANRKDLKNLSLTAHNRKLRKRGDAVWMGHGRQLCKEEGVCEDGLGGWRNI